MGQTIIVGGGAIGLSLAYHLGKQGVRDVLLLERNTLTSGTTWHAAGIVGPLRATANLTRLAMYAGTLFPELERETDLSTGYRETGGYWLARCAERMDELHRIAALGRHFGLHPVVTTAAEIAQALPDIETNGVVGALSVAEDATVNPVDLCMAYAKAARSYGVEIREYTAVQSLERENHQIRGVTLASGEQIRADNVAVCAGAWSGTLTKTAGVSLPIQPVEHMYIVTEPMPNIAHPFPVVRDLDAGIYVKGDAGKLIIGGFEPNAKCWDPSGPDGDRPYLEFPSDWEQFGPFMDSALKLMPALEKAGIQLFMNGPESFTTDTKPLIGQTPDVDGLFVAAGMNSVGVMSSAGIGQALSAQMIDPQLPMDLWEVDVARVDPATTTTAHLAARVVEAVADQFSLHWPYKQPSAGRGIRKSAIHDCWAAQRAHFGLTAGWERGLWYAENPSEADLPYSVGRQHWQAIAEREAAEMVSGTVLIDLSPFSKFDVSGADALDVLNFHATANLDQPIGTSVFTPFLNDHGGIEMDTTVTRTSAQGFRVTSGAATRFRDLAYLRRAAAGHNLAITDQTEAEVVIGVMGAGSQGVLAGLTDDWTRFPFGTSRQMMLCGVEVRATRRSYVGELGWEVNVPIASASCVFEALIAAGAKPMGHYALDSCRIEKGFKHWGHDLGPTLSPLEAGLGFAIDWDKDFRGKDRLLAQRKAGLARRLHLLDISGDPLPLHDEPIWDGDTVVGLTTSGATGVRTGLTLAFGLITLAPGETVEETCRRNFKIEIAGRKYPAKVLKQPPFDPAGSRMRA